MQIPEILGGAAGAAIGDASSTSVGIFLARAGRASRAGGWIYRAGSLTLGAVVAAVLWVESCL